MIHSAEKRAFRTNAGTDVSTQHQTPAQLTQIIAAVSQTGVGGRCQLFSDDVRCCHVLSGHLICSGLLNPTALFALADFHVFSVIYAALSCAAMFTFAGYSAPRVHQSVVGGCLPIRPSPEPSSPERGMIDKLA